MPSVIEQNSTRRWPDSRLWVMLLLLLPAMAMILLWFWVHGSPFVYLNGGAPDGQALYVLSKLAALVGVVVIGCQICSGLLRRAGVLPQMTATAVRWHAALGCVAVGLALTHALGFFGAVSVRTDTAAWSLFIPRPLTGYYETGLAFGIFALLLLSAVFLAGIVRSYRIRLARIVHHLALPGYLLVLLHAWMIGSESRYFFTIVVVCLLLLIIAVLLFARCGGNASIFHARNTRR